MTLKILFKDGTKQAIALKKGENIRLTVKNACKYNRWDESEIVDYWIER